MRPPRRLSTGTLGVFAPASPFDPERFASGLSILRSLGYETKVHPLATARRGFLAGSDEERRGALIEMLLDPEVDGLIGARGGYGVTRLLEGWTRDELAASDKPIVGFSDLTALHAAAFRAERISIHGPVVTQLGDLADVDHQTLVRVLSGDWGGLEYPSAAPAITGGAAEGMLFGGCLSVLAALTGTDLLALPDDAILLIEDIGEAPYRVDRMLTHLRMAGVLTRARGIAVGDFIDCRPQREGEPSVEEVLVERLADLGVPVLPGLPFGHGRRNLAVPHGARVLLDADAGVLRLER